MATQELFGRMDGHEWSMAASLYLVLLVSGLAVGAAASSQEESSLIWVTLSRKGLDYVKEVLLTDVLQAITPFPFPDVSRSATVPFIGNVDTSFTNITLLRAHVPDSTIALGPTGLTLQALGVQSDLLLHWVYAYSTGWLPTPLSDQGRADIKVVGMQAGVSVEIERQSGSLHLTTLQCGTYIEDLKVQLIGDSSWLYQWMIDGLENNIRVMVEEQLQAQVEGGVEKLNSFLLALPKQVKVDETADLNFTIVCGPVLSPTSISIGLNGEFVSHINVEKTLVQRGTKMPPELVCSGDLAMVAITLSEAVLNSAADIYYNAGLLNWLVDRVPDQSLLNTSKWKYLIPQLYQQYPNKGLRLYFEVLSSPSIAITYDGLKGDVFGHMVIEVINDKNIVPVACIAVTASVNGLASIEGNNITGQIGMKGLSLNLEWSDVGNIHLTLIEVLLRTLVKDVLTPLLNLNLKRGFPLPVIPYVELRDANVKYGDGFLLVCTDVKYMGLSK